jgi:hypothetical protein
MRTDNQASARSRGPVETGRYVLLVDRQAKGSFDDRDAAEAEAKRILERFPHLRVGVEDREHQAAPIRRRS